MIVRAHVAVTSMRSGAEDRQLAGALACVSDSSQKTRRDTGDDASVGNARDLARIRPPRPGVQPAQHIVVMLLEPFVRAIAELTVSDVIAEARPECRRSCAGTVDHADVPVARSLEHVDRSRLEIAQQQLAGIALGRDRDDG